MTYISCIVPYTIISNITDINALLYDMKKGKRSKNEGRERKKVVEKLCLLLQSGNGKKLPCFFRSSCGETTVFWDIFLTHSAKGSFYEIEKLGGRVQLGSIKNQPQFFFQKKDSSLPRSLLVNGKNIGPTFFALRQSWAQKSKAEEKKAYQ